MTQDALMHLCLAILFAVHLEDASRKDPQEL